MNTTVKIMIADGIWIVINKRKKGIYTSQWTRTGPSPFYKRINPR